MNSTDFALGLITGISLMGVATIEGNIIGTIACVLAGGFALSVYARRSTKAETEAK